MVSFYLSLHKDRDFVFSPGLSPASTTMFDTDDTQKLLTQALINILSVVCLFACGIFSL